MIVFDLRCDRDHVFEAWFGSSTAYEEQRAGGLLVCPVCGTDEVGKALMAPAIQAKGSAVPATDAEAGKAALRGLAAAQARALASSEWVGTAFAGRARAMHAGDEPHATIHGQATLADARALAADGVPIAPLPLPVVPPDRIN